MVIAMPALFHMTWTGSCSSQCKHKYKEVVRVGQKEDKLGAFMAIEREMCQKDATRCLELKDSTYRA